MTDGIGRPIDRDSVRKICELLGYQPNVVRSINAEPGQITVEHRPTGTVDTVFTTHPVFR